MYKPDIRIIEPQFVESKHIEISNAESERLLAKYGYIKTNNNNKSINVDNNLTFEEMIKKHETENKKNIVIKPNVYSIDPNTVKYHQLNYVNIDDMNFGITVEIVSDMK